MHQERIDQVLANLEKEGCHQAIISDPMSIFYLTGYYTEPYERFFALFVSTDETVLFANRLFPDATPLCPDVVIHDDTEDPLPALTEHIDHDAVLGLDKNFPARWVLPLIDGKAASSFILASKAVDDARSIKSAEEQQLMREASRVNDEAMGWLKAQIKAGVTERSIAERLLGEYRSLGAEDHSFTPIVSFGANAADPHHEPDDTVLNPGDMVLFDVGCKKDAYCSDMTRTFFTAEPTDEQRLVYETVRKANQAAEAKIRPGVTFAELDLTARKVISDAGFGEYFTHRLGHQIGLNDHEPGDVSATHDEPVQVGQCFSIEPGIYIPGKIGVRIEDLVIVTEDGCEVLNSYPRDIEVVNL